MNKWLLFRYLLLVPLLGTAHLYAQKLVFIGVVKDKQSDEPIPFASVFFKLSGKGSLTDSTGTFTINAEQIVPNDSLRISGVGYNLVTIPYSALKANTLFEIKLEVAHAGTEAVVKSKYNRALWFWRQIIKHKPYHDRTTYNNYGYEIYNKLEVDIQNFKKESFEKNKLLKPLNFILDFVDSTSEDKPFLPAYITETLSDYYYQKNPHKARELIKATRTNGIENESLVKELGGMYQNVNVYSNTIPIFNRQFISPFNDNGDNYYNFKLLDTQYLSSKRLIHLRFTPKHKGEDTFEGDCWIHDASYAVQKITLRPQEDASLNFVTGMSLIQEFKLINDTAWFLYKDKFVADIAPISKNKVGLKGRKTTTYKNILVNDTSVVTALNKTKAIEKVELSQNHQQNSDSFWVNNRHEVLTQSEQSVYKLLDTLTNNPTYIGYRNTIQFVAKGTKDIGNIRIGPWFYWLSDNQYEGRRVRFDLATNKNFDKHWNLHGYLAYGFRDEKFKGKAEVKYQFNSQPWGYINVSYRNDMDNGQTRYDQLATDNLFAAALRRGGIVQKFQRAEEKKIEYYQETNKGFGFGFSVTEKQIEPLANLPDAKFFTQPNAFNTFETSVRLRYAYAERTLESNFNRISLGSDFPIVDFTYTHAFNGVLSSGNQYDKLNLSVRDFLKVAPYGKIYYNLFAGKTFGTATYSFLDILPGNEARYFNRQAFNLMNRFEYIADSYAGFNVEHNVGSGLFRFTPLTRKLKWRQLWTARGVIGNLSQANQKLNFVGSFPFKNLNNKMYLELGTGIDNILQFFRVDFVWRVLSPSPSAETVDHFGVFGSFHFSF
ncbi:DUF5686 family protein [Parasediminibacterium paludis]|uniref:DUF5686 family protein n=1 Tax=Parasediminibacterium paludis TaxID=908966 RepID=A0ABV8PUM3_9BACT